MDGDWLAEQLDAGVSIEAIARQLGKHPSTVSYWVNRHGLASTFADRHAARGGIPRDVLEPLVVCGMSIRQIARSSTAVRERSAIGCASTTSRLSPPSGSGGTGAPHRR